MKLFLFSVSLLYSSLVISQSSIETISEINLENIQNNQVKKYWLTMIDNSFSQPISIPVIIFKGKEEGSVLATTKSNTKQAGRILFLWHSLLRFGI